MILVDKKIDNFLENQWESERYSIINPREGLTQKWGN